MGFFRTMQQKFSLQRSALLAGNICSRPIQKKLIHSTLPQPTFIESQGTRHYHYAPTPFEDKLLTICKRLGYPQYMNWAERITLTPPFDQGDSDACMQAATIGVTESFYISNFGEKCFLDLGDLWRYTGGDYAKADPEDIVRKEIHDFMFMYGALSSDGRKRVKVRFVDVPGVLAVLQALQKSTIYSNLQATPGFSVLRSRLLWGNLKGYVTNHAVEIIGYHLRTCGPSYFIVKNSHGIDWGVNGVGKIRIGAGGLGKYGFAPCNIEVCDSSTIVPDYAPWVKKTW